LEKGKAMSSNVLTKKEILKLFKDALIDSSPSTLQAPSSVDRLIGLCIHPGAYADLDKSTRIECIFEENDYDGSENHRVVFKITQKIKDRSEHFFICATGYYSSWSDSEFFQVYECEPFERTIIDWRKVSQVASKDEPIIKKKVKAKKASKIKKKKVKKKKK
jgi:hypothetical protein